MKQVIFGIFAHPDDEAFGVGPTLIGESRRGADVRLITLTAGQNGVNVDNLEDLAAVRLQEWHAGGEIMGATAFHHLGYIDGELSNSDIDEITHTIEEIVSQALHEDNDTLIEFMTFETNGITGHIDHIVASHVACLSFFRLKERWPTRMTRVRLRCLSERDQPTRNVGWRYMQPGVPDSEIGETIDGSEYHDDIVAAIRAHHSQRTDGEGHIARRGDTIGINHFIVLE